MLSVCYMAFLLSMFFVNKEAFNFLTKLLDYNNRLSLQSLFELGGEVKCRAIQEIPD